MLGQSRAEARAQLVCLPLPSARSPDKDNSHPPTPQTLGLHSQASSCCSVGERDVYQLRRGSAGVPEGRTGHKVVHPRVVDRKIGPW